MPQATPPPPAAKNGALPAVGYAVARAALRYGVARGRIQDETTQGRVTIQDAVNRVAHTCQMEVALHTRGGHGGPLEGIVVEPTGMVLVLAANMAHAFQVQRARPQWTIQVYTPPRVWPFYIWAVPDIMWHRAPEDNPTGTAEEIAQDLQAGRPTRTSPGPDPKTVSEWRLRRRGSAWRRPSSGTQTKGRAPFCRQVRYRPPRQTQDGSGTQRRHNRCRTPGCSHFGTCQRVPWLMPPRPSKGSSSRPRPLAPPRSAACKRERPGFGGERKDARARTSPWCQGRLCLTPQTCGEYNGGWVCPTRRPDG